MILVLKGALASRHVLWLVPAITAGLLAFGLDDGWMVDDYVHQAALTRHPDLPALHRSPGSLFTFVDGDPERLGEVVSRGIWPWWSAPELRLAFWRPISGLSHALDYRWGQLGFPPPDVTNLLPDAARWRAWAVVFGLLALVAWCLRPVLRREATARCLGLGMLLALLPASSTFASSRLLGFAGIGGAGLLALWIAELASSASNLRRRALLTALAAVHLVAAPLLIHPTISQMKQLDRVVGSSAASLAELAPGPLPTADSQVIIVATPSGFISLASAIVATMNHGWHAPTTLVLSSSIYPTEVTRTGDATLLIRPRGGFLRSAGSPAPAGVEDAGSGLDPRRALLMLDHLFRDLERDRFAAGDRIALAGVTLEIVDEDAGRPLAVAFRFAEPLDSQRWHWLAWRGGRYERFPLPELGETVTWP